MGLKKSGRALSKSPERPKVGVSAISAAIAHVPRENAIRASIRRIRVATTEDIDNPEWPRFVRNLEWVTHQRSNRLLRRMKDLYSLISAPDERLDARGPVDKAETQLYELERRFMLDFCELMTKGNFLSLSQAELDFAEVEEFHFNLPIEIDLKRLNPHGMLTRFLSQHGDLPVLRGRAGLNDAILVFHRGIGHAEITGKFVQHKLHLALAHLLRLLGCGVLWRREGLCAERAGCWRGTGRATVKSLHPTLGATLRGLLTRCTIREPTFKQVILLFRSADDDHSALPGRANDHGAAQCGGYDSDVVGSRRIHLKSFRDVPLSDLEVVFPHSKVRRARSARQCSQCTRSCVLESAPPARWHRCHAPRTAHRRRSTQPSSHHPPPAARRPPPAARRPPPTARLPPNAPPHPASDQVLPSRHAEAGRGHACGSGHRDQKPDAEARGGGVLLRHAHRAAQLYHQREPLGRLGQHGRQQQRQQRQLRR